MFFMKTNLSVVIPAYKEEKRIHRCIKESLFFLRENKHIGKFEIIFVADVSGDKTISIIQEYMKENTEIQLIVNTERQQKGGSVKIGMLQAQYSVVIFYDVDLSTPLYEINDSLKLLKTYHVVIGSRGLKESNVEKNQFKIFLSKGFSFFKWVILGLHFTDTQCGFKMFRKEIVSLLFERQHLKSSCFDVELLYIAKKYNLNIKEKPITWIDSDMSNFNTLHVVLSFFRELVKIRWNDWKGYYKK